MYDGHSLLISASLAHMYASSINNTNGQVALQALHAPVSKCLVCDKHTMRQWHQQCTGLRIHRTPCHLATVVEALNDLTVSSGAFDVACRHYRHWWEWWL